LAIGLQTIPEVHEKGDIVLRRYVIATAAVMICSGYAGAAQSPSPTAQQPPSQQASTVLTGCVYREKDVPGRAPNVAERAGVLEDYILAEVRPASAPSAPGTAGTSGSAKAASMYKLELIADEKLRAVVGKRVEVTGRIDAEPGDAKAPAAAPPTSQTDKVIGRDKIDLPEFEVTDIKEVAGTCPATPSGR
jgi:hypothetical protein